MKNLCSINHNNFEKLYELTNNYNKATLLDKCIYWWQISTFTLPNSTHIWFTRSRERIAAESKLSLRSIDRYLNEFVKEGFIEKTNKLFVKKHLYIRVTNKLLQLIGLTEKGIITQSKTPQISITPLIPQQEDTNQQQNCINLTQDGEIDFANLAVSIYKDQDNKINNSTVSDDNIVNNLENKKQTNKPSTRYPQYPIEKIIGEQLTPQFTNYIKGTLNNIQQQHKIKFSSPEQLFAEIVFSILNKQHQFIGIEDNIHRMNLIAKLLRQNKWKTPKGFFNHSEIGQKFIKQTKKPNLPKQSEQKAGGEDITVVRECLTQSPSNSNITRVAFNADTKQTQEKLHSIQVLIQSETKYLNDMLHLHKIKPSTVYEVAIHSSQLTLQQLSDTYEDLKEKLNANKIAA